MGTVNPRKSPLFQREFKERLKNRRRDLNARIRAEKGEKITQQTIAAQLHVSIDSVKSWERGESLPSLEHLAELCDVLQCDADFLLGRTDVPLHEEKTLPEMTELSDEACVHLQVMKNMATDYFGRQYKNGILDTFDAILSNEKIFGFLSECYMYMLTSLRYLEACFRARNHLPHDRRYEKVSFGFSEANGTDVDYAILAAEDAGKCHEFRALEIMHEIIEDMSAFNSTDLIARFHQIYSEDSKGLEKPVRLHHTDFTFCTVTVDIAPESIAEEFRLMLESVLSTLSRKRRTVTQQQSAYLEVTFEDLLHRLSFLRSYNAPQAAFAAFRMAKLYMSADAHRVHFVDDPLGRIAAAAGVAREDILQPPRKASAD